MYRMYRINDSIDWIREIFIVLKRLHAIHKIKRILKKIIS